MLIHIASDKEDNYTEDEKNIMLHEYNLRQFIDIALRWNIDAIYSTVNERFPFSTVLEGFVNNSRTLFEPFKNSLRKELTKHRKEYWEAYGIDLKERFFPMMGSYKRWYSENKNRTEKFNSYNPYEMMHEVIISTEKEIEKYFPEPEEVNLEFVVYGIAKTEVIAQVLNKKTKTEKVEYLKWVLRSINIEKGIDYYAQCKPQKKPVPVVWKGIMEKRAGMNNTDRYSGYEKEAYEFGQNLFADYCLYKDWLDNLETGKELNLELVPFYQTKIYEIDSFEKAQSEYQKEFTSVYNNFRLTHNATSKDFKYFPKADENTLLSFNPTPNSTVEANYLLTKCYSALICAVKKKSFYETYRSWNIHSIEAEIKRLESFIDKANKENYTEACKAYKSFGTDRDEYVYLRLKNGFYQNLSIEQFPELSDSCQEAKVYGEYFLFYDFLNKEMVHLNAIPKHRKEIHGLNEILHFLENDKPKEDFENYNQLIDKFAGLEDYINKNVHEDVRADLDRLMQLDRNLSNWLYLLRSVFKEPLKEPAPYSVEKLNTGKIEAIGKLERKLENALTIIQKRIKGKEHGTEIKTEPTKSQILRDKLETYNFFDLDKIKVLSEESKIKLLDLISENEAPYQIAMLDFLGFIGYLDKKILRNKTRLFSVLGEMLGITDRTAKGNYYVLDAYSKENRDRYTSHLQKENVERAYQSLK